MRSACLIVAVLGFAGPVLLRADDKPAKPVVVDPLDLRKPIPNPEAGLTEKYDGKLVRFTGRVKNSGQDAKTKTYWYDLQTEVVHRTGVVNAKGATNPSKGAQKTVKELVVVRAYFQTAQNSLRQQSAENAATVEGLGEISLLDGSLAIRKATVLHHGKG